MQIHKHQLSSAQRFKRRLATTIIGLSVVLSGYVQAQWYSRVEPMMGTEVKVELWEPEPQFAEKRLQGALDRMHQVEAIMSSYKASSELTHINRHAFMKTVPISQAMLDVLQEAQRIAELTGGAFDISFASVGFHYDFRSGLVPDASTRDQLLPVINFKSIELSSKGVRFAHRDLKIDLGGIAKGYAVDQAIEYLRSEGVDNALVTAGGDSRILGDRLGKPWMIGVRNPRGERSSSIVALPLAEVAVSTSGDYERYFEKDGVRYHHIIDPNTGDSAREVRSATVLAEQAIVSDGLSTAVFVLGVEKGLELVQSIDDVSAIIVDASGNVHYSNDLTSER